MGIMEKRMETAARGLGFRVWGWEYRGLIWDNGREPWKLLGFGVASKAWETFQTPSSHGRNCCGAVVSLEPRKASKL